MNLSMRRPRYQVLESRIALDGDPLLLANGAEHEATIDLGDTVELEFEAVAGKPVYLAWGATAGGRLDVRVTSPGGEVVSDTLSSSTAPRTFVPNETGAYLVTLSERGADETVSFRFSAFSGAAPIDHGSPDRVLLASGEEHEATIGLGRQQLIQFQVEAGETIYGSIGALGSTNQQHLRVLDPAGDLIHEEAYEQASVVELSPFAVEATMTGLYTAVVSERNHDAPIDSLFTVAALPSVVDYGLPQNALLESGGRHDSLIDHRGQHHLQFHADAGEKLFVALGEQDFDAFRSGSIGIRLVDPSGELIYSETDTVGIGALLVAPESGLYTAIIDGGVEPPLSPEPDTPYAFSVAALPGAVDYNPPQNTLLGYGGVHASGFGVGDQHLIQFEAMTGDDLQLDLTETTPDGDARPRLRLVDPSGKIVFSGADADAIQTTITAAENGLYTAVLTEVGNDDPLTYSFALGLSPSPIRGDYDRNGFVDQLDHDLWRLNYGSTSGDGLRADGNGDGVVNAADYSVWRDNLGAGTPPAPAATEPVSNLIVAPQTETNRTVRSALPRRESLIYEPVTARQMALLLTLADETPDQTDALPTTSVERDADADSSEDPAGDKAPWGV